MQLDFIDVETETLCKFFVSTLGPVVQSNNSLMSSLRGQLVFYDFITKYTDIFC